MICLLLGHKWGNLYDMMGPGRCLRCGKPNGA